MRSRPKLACVARSTASSPRRELVVGGGAALGGEVAITEAVVGALTDALRAEAPDPAAVIESFRGYIG